MCCKHSGTEAHSATTATFLHSALSCSSLEERGFTPAPIPYGRESAVPSRSGKPSIRTELPKSGFAIVSDWSEASYVSQWGGKGWTGGHGGDANSSFIRDMYKTTWRLFRWHSTHSFEHYITFPLFRGKFLFHFWKMSSEERCVVWRWLHNEPLGCWKQINEQFKTMAHSKFL